MKRFTKIAVILVSIAIGAYLMFTLGYLVAENKTPQAPTSVPLNADVIFNLVNDERVKNGLKPLVRDARLDGTAQERASDMNYRNYFSHRDPVTNENLVNILKGQSQCADASENISWNTPPAAADDNKAVVVSWMESNPHHDAILNADYDISGLAISSDKIVQHFCNLK